MKILVLTTHINTGGITSYLITLVKGLIQKGHTVWVVSSGGDKEAVFRRMGVNLINMNIKTKSELSLKLYSSIGPIRKLIEDNNIEVIHAHTRITQVMAQLLSRKTGRVFVATCHGFFKTRLSRRLYPCWGDATIAISHAVYKHLVDDFKVKADNVVLIENGIDIDDFHCSSPKQKRNGLERLKITGGPIIGIIARLSDVKGIDVLINAMKQVAEKLSSTKLLIMGEGREESNLKQLVSDLKLESSVYFIPKVEDLSAMYGLFDVFVMPSRQEGLGLSVMEAQACGCCVIGSRVGGIPSLIEDGRTGFLVEPENVEALAHTICQVLSDDKKRKEIGQNAREFIINNFSSETMVEKTINLYLRQMV